MSNGIYKSPVHRVVTNREKERISVATFCVKQLPSMWISTTSTINRVEELLKLH